ncbi:MAG: ABC transporter ATP-binding protein [Chloroflexi bacterium]|nr:ABC transporter ATP-binding protein [Chloroflexota bacterium]MBM3165827.1 ABC transporter ATP-binding protein [Chloroflexota bacterium]MBM3172460.1 ABC transporter ATP-binding protein [Chloroflexota bacterium]MBM4449311.1 ABC transporter ATP-binding protein [Chloroflexota bacterium]
MKPSIKLDGVSKIYTMGEIDVVALNNVSFEISPGEFLVLLGPSGSGKTTLLNLIGGLDKPSSGLIEVNGFKVSRMNRSQLTHYRRTQVGFIFQTFNLIPTLTAKENVEFAADLVTNHPSAEQLMESVGLGHRLNHFPSELSGGENQRVAIARALATDPAIMLCDEPTGSLDFETGKRIFKLLRELNKTQQKTVVVVTHNATVGEIADRVLKMRDGRIAKTIINEHPLDPDKLEW